MLIRILVFSALVISLPAAAQQAANAPSPVVSEQADALVKQMGAYTGPAQQFTFHADILFDHMLPPG
jgi:hypothetical protein